MESPVALTNVTLPYALKLADLGVEAACEANPVLMRGVYMGRLVCQTVAEAQGLPYEMLF